jgi:mRNA-degrading endonuclease RelE of RelBE toxin-antitoxin system
LGKSRQFTIELSPAAREELEAIRPFDRRRVSDAMRSQLNREPLAVTRNRKPLFGVAADFEFEPPLWELKTGEFRVCYDVNETTLTVNVRAIRRKPPGKTTAEILR